MRKLKIDAGDYEYLNGMASYAYEIENKALVSVKISASEMFDVWLEKELPEGSDKEPQMFPVWSGTFCTFEIQATGFVGLHIKTRKSNKMAVRIFARHGSEELDPTPLSVSLASEKDITLKEQIRREMSAILAENRSGLTVDDFDLSPLDGDFDDYEDEGLTPHQVAEFNRLHGQDEVVDDDDEPDEPEGTTPPEVAEDTEEPET